MNEGRGRESKALTEVIEEDSNINISFKELESGVITDINRLFRYQAFDFTNITNREPLRKSLSEKYNSLLHMSKVVRLIQDIGVMDMKAREQLEELLNLINGISIVMLEGNIHFSDYKLKGVYDNFTSYVFERGIELDKGEILDWTYKSETTKRLELISEYDDTSRLELIRQYEAKYKK